MKRRWLRAAQIFPVLAIGPAINANGYAIRKAKVFDPLAETTVIDWGCPVLETVCAESQEDALSKSRRECVEKVTLAARKKPQVLEVLRTSIISPDVSVSSEADGYHLKGTFVLETQVLKK